MLGGDEKALRELRVKIDPGLHQKLHVMKVLRNRSLTDTIHDALERYFAAVMPPPASEENKKLDAPR